MIRGYAMVKGSRVPLRDVRVEGGSLVFWFKGPGPFPASGDDPVEIVIFGEDDAELYRGLTYDKWPEALADDIFELCVTLTPAGDKEEVPGGQAG